MPGIFSSASNRREFIRHSALAGLSMAVAGCATTTRTTTARGSLNLALLSDTHIPGDANNEYRGFKPVENLTRILPTVTASNPHGVILNGDAARLEGKPEDYARLREMLSPIADRTPVYIGLGNHDHRENFFKAFSYRPGEHPEITGKHVIIIDHPAVRIIQLDSLLYVNQTAGLLGRGQRAWLETYLRTADKRPTVLFIHHTLSDGDGDLLDVDRLFAILAPHRHVKAIFYGHSHVWEITKRQGIVLINLPAVGYNFDDKDPVGWVMASFSATGVDLILNAIAGNTSQNGRMTKVRWG